VVKCGPADVRRGYLRSRKLWTVTADHGQNEDFKFTDQTAVEEEVKLGLSVNTTSAHRRPVFVEAMSNLRNAKGETAKG